MTGTMPPEIFYALPDLQFIVLGTNAGEPVWCRHAVLAKPSSSAAMTFPESIECYVTQHLQTAPLNATTHPSSEVDT